MTHMEVINNSVLVSALLNLVDITCKQWLEMIYPLSESGTKTGL